MPIIHWDNGQPSTCVCIPVQIFWWQERKTLKEEQKAFVSRIATGDYDCIIMPHSSFELVGLSRERQLSAMQREIDEVTVQIGATKAMEGKKWSLKQMEIFRHNLQTRFDNLYNAEKKDDTIISRNWAWIIFS